MKAKREEPERPPPEDGLHPFERFKEFARRIVSVPKSEVEERERAYREERRERRT